MRIGERIREYLLSNTALVTLLGGEYIYASGVGVREVSKAIFVDYQMGDDLNYIPIDKDIISIYIVVSLSVLNPEQTCKDITDAVDDLLNKHENLISNDDYLVYNFVRRGSGDFSVDDDAQEVTSMLSYDYAVYNE